jgi:hypothetical protein
MNKLIKPLAIFIGLYMFWLFADNILDEFDFFARFWWYIYHLLLKITKLITSNFLSFFWNINISFADYRELVLPDGRIVMLWNKYLGYDIMALFSCFIIAWPAKLKTKLWFIPTGSALIFLVNNLLISFIIKHIYFLDKELPMPELDKYKTILFILSVIFWIIFILYFANKDFIKSFDLNK